jgi:5-methylcytosine-specific restriction protein A
MKRREFPRTVRVAVIKRATKDSVVYCESCHGLAKRFQIDHVRADGLLGEPTIENAQLICEACWAVKNPKDTASIAKAKRREARHVGATRPSCKIKSAGFKPTPRVHVGRDPANGLTGLARRYEVKA